MRVRYQFRGVYIALGIIVLLSFILRLYHLDYQSLWTDEIYTWEIGDADNLGDLLDKFIIPDVHPPIYQLIIYYIEHYLGDSETLLRVPSAISGALSVLGLFLVGRLLYSEKEGLIAAALMAVAFSPIYYSQEARSYGLMAMILMFATYFWLRLIIQLYQKSAFSVPLTLCYIALAALSCYVHYYSLVFLGIQAFLALLIFWKKWPQLRHFFVSYFLIGLIFAPWVPILITQYKHHNAFWTFKPEPKEIWEFLKFVYAPSNNLTAVFLVFIGLALASKVFGAYRNRANSRVSETMMNLPIQPDIIVVFWFVAPFVMTYFYSLVISPILEFRYLIFLLPAGYLLLARAVGIVPIRSRLQYLFAGAIIVWLLYRLFFTWDYYSVVQKEQFREAAQYIVDHDSRYSNAVVIGGMYPHFALDYYFESSGSTKRTDFVVKADEKTISNMAQLIDVITSGKYIWYVDQQIMRNLAGDDVINYLTARLKTVDHVKLFMIDVYLFENQS